MKNHTLYLLILSAHLVFGCTREQYKGSHISEPKQETLTDESNNYHVRETQKVLTRNERRNERRKEKCEKQRIKQKNTELSSKNSKYKKRRSLVMDFY